MLALSAVAIFCNHSGAIELFYQLFSYQILLRLTETEPEKSNEL